MVCNMDDRHKDCAKAKARASLAIETDERPLEGHKYCSYGCKFLKASCSKRDLSGLILYYVTVRRFRDLAARGGH